MNSCKHPCPFIINVVLIQDGPIFSLLKDLCAFFSGVYVRADKTSRQHWQCGQRGQRPYHWGQGHGWGGERDQGPDGAPQ